MNLNSDLDVYDLTLKLASFNGEARRSRVSASHLRSRLTALLTPSMAAGSNYASTLPAQARQVYILRL